MSEDLRFDFNLRFQALADNARLPNPQQMDSLANSDGIWEIKAKEKRVHWRAAAFEVGHKAWFVTHFFITSHGTKQIKKEAKTAQQARREHFDNEGVI